MSTTDKYRAEEPRYLWYCGTKKYRKGDGTGTVEKWYRVAAVVPWYRETLLFRLIKILRTFYSVHQLFILLSPELTAKSLNDYKRLNIINEKFN